MKSLRILRVDASDRQWLDDLVTEEIPLRTFEEEELAQVAQ